MGGIQNCTDTKRRFFYQIHKRYSPYSSIPGIGTLPHVLILSPDSNTIHIVLCIIVFRKLDLMNENEVRLLELSNPIGWVTATTDDNKTVKRHMGSY